MRGFLFLAATILLGSSVGAYQTRSKSGPFQPEIGYVYRSGNQDELRLANESGTDFVPLLQTASGSVGQIDLSPRSLRQVVYTENGVLNLLTYPPLTYDAFLAVDRRTIYAGPGRVRTMDFSRDGSRIAFYVDTINKIMVHDLATGTNRDLAAADNVRELAWYHDGSGLVFHARVSNSGNDGIYELAATGGTPVLLLEEAIIYGVDTARTNKTLLVTHNRVHPRHGQRYAGRQVVSPWRDGAYVRDILAFGSHAHFNCDDDKLIYRSSILEGVTYIHTFSRGRTRQFLPGGNISDLDWIPTCVPG